MSALLCDFKSKADIMSEAKITDAFKHDAVAQTEDRSHSVRELLSDLGPLPGR